jgi:hypothetical protein
MDERDLKIAHLEEDRAKTQHCILQALLHLLAGNTEAAEKALLIRMSDGAASAYLAAKKAMQK